MSEQKDWSKVVSIRNQDAAKEIYDFIRAHLDVVNDTAYVAYLMLVLEYTFDCRRNEVRWDACAAPKLRMHPSYLVRRKEGNYERQGMGSYHVG